MRKITESFYDRDDVEKMNLDLCTHNDLKYAHRIYEVTIGDNHFIVTADRYPSDGDLETIALDKVANYCSENKEYRPLIYSFTDIWEREGFGEDNTEEQIDEYISDKYTPVLEYNYFIDDEDFEIEDVTQKFRMNMGDKNSELSEFIKDYYESDEIEEYNKRRNKMRNSFTFKACIGEPSNVYFQQSYNNDNNGWIVFKFDKLFAMDSKNKYPKLDYVKDAKLYVCLAGISDFANVSGVYDYEDIENENNIENVLEIIEDIVKNDRLEFIFENYKADGMGIYDVKLSDIKDKYKLLCVVDVKGSQIYVNLDDGVRSDRGDSMFSSWYSGLLNSFFEVEIDVNKIGNDEDIYESRKLRRNKMKKVYESRSIRKPLRKINEKKVMKEEHRFMSGREILDILSDYIINAYSDELTKADDWSDVLDVVNAEIKEWNSPLASIIYKKLNIADKNMEECNDSKKLKESKRLLRKRTINESNEKYDYREAVKDSIYDYLDSEYDRNDYTKENYKDLRDSLYDELFNNDDVTGNGSGSYTYNREQAKEYFLSDPNAEKYLKMAAREFDINSEEITDKLKDYEWLDVTIRCYLLGGCIDDALDEWFNEKDMEECNDSKKLKESIKNSIQKRMMKEEFNTDNGSDAHSIAVGIMDDLNYDYGKEEFIDVDLYRRVSETLDNYFIYDKDIREMIKTYAKDEYNDGSYTIKELTNIAYENAYGEVLSEVEKMVKKHNEDVEKYNKEDDEELDEKCGKKVKTESRFNRKIAKH